MTTISGRRKYSWAIRTRAPAPLCAQWSSGAENTRSWHVSALRFRWARDWTKLIWNTQCSYSQPAKRQGLGSTHNRHVASAAAASSLMSGALSQRSATNSSSSRRSAPSSWIGTLIHTIIQVFSGLQYSYARRTRA